MAPTPAQHVNLRSFSSSGGKASSKLSRGLWSRCSRRGCFISATPGSKSRHSPDRVRVVGDAMAECVLPAYNTRDNRQPGYQVRQWRYFDLRLRSHRVKTQPGAPHDRPTSSRASIPPRRIVHHESSRLLRLRCDGFATASKTGVLHRRDAQYDPSELLACSETDYVLGQRLEDQPIRSAAPHHHRPPLSPHGEAAVRTAGARC